jgi:hypothetical protein
VMFTAPSATDATFLTILTILKRCGPQGQSRSAADAGSAQRNAQAVATHSPKGLRLLTARYTT